MKIYHTETQADYDGLMVELEEQGAKWFLTINPTESNNWPEFEHQTGIKVQDGILTYHGVEYFERANPETPIIKYTAKKETRLQEWVKRLVRDQNVELCSYSVAELNRNMNAKAHGYDEVPEVANKTERVHAGKDGVEVTVGETTSISFEEVMTLVENDMINQPNHYIGEYGLEVEDVLRNFIPRYTDPYVGHRIASAIEYLLRSPLKNGQQDIEKARKNLDQALGYMEKKELK